jgi:CRISPR-associated protein (TIGR02710 family)
VTTGLRDNTRAVNRGQATREVGITNLRTQRHLEQQVSRCLQNFDYSGAQNQLKGLLRPRDLSPELRKRIQWLGSICDALAHWDNFAHQAALECIDSPPFRASKFVLERLYKPLDRLVKLKTQLSDSGPLPPGTCGYELVEDLILNAQRRAQSGRYDDAVGRYYRALEMLAQRRLKIKHDIDTSKVEEKQIPPSLLAKLPPAEDGIRKFGLRQSYELLQALEDPTIAAPYAAQAKELLNALKVRNNSLFAHGYDPIGPREYQEFHSLVDGFMQPLLSELFAKSPRATQLPKKLDEIFSFPTSGVGR